MYMKKIFDLAHEAIALQNKDRMDAALREIRDIAFPESMKTCFEDKRVELLTEQLKQAGMEPGIAYTDAPEGGDQ